MANRPDRQVIERPKEMVTAGWRRWEELGRGEKKR